MAGRNKLAFPYAAGDYYNRDVTPGRRSEMPLHCFLSEIPAPSC
jgi:hypothetical protein